MKINDIIEKDKIRTVSDDFYDSILTKMSAQKSPKIKIYKKRHIGISVAVGILLGIFMGNFQSIIKHHHHYRHEKIYNWINKYNINEIELETIETRLFN